MRRTAPLLLLILLAGCSKPAPKADAPAEPKAAEPKAAEATPAPPKADVPVVHTTSFVADWLVRRVGGDAVTTACIQPRDTDPPHWQPPGDVVAQLADAKLIIAHGLGFEAWMKTATLPESKVVYALAGAKAIEVQSATHSHGKGGEHSHGDIDPHAWHDVDAFGDGAAAVADALSEAFPHRKRDFQANLTALRGELSAIDAAHKGLFAAAKGKRFAANHPTWRYLSRRYGLAIESFDWDPEAPAEGAGEQFSAWAGEQPVAAILWESEPSEAVQAQFPEGTRHVALDPLEGPSGEGDYDYLAQVRANLAIWKDLLGG